MHINTTQNNKSDKINKRELMQGKVLKLFLTLDNPQKDRISKDKIDVDENGILEDKFYAKDSQRAILISSLESYKIARDSDITITEGALGENILIDVNPYGLLPGEKIQIGDIVLEITQNCTICKGLSQVDKKLPSLLKNDRGIFAKVVSTKGNITLEDKVLF